MYAGTKIVHLCTPHKTIHPTKSAGAFLEDNMVYGYVLYVITLEKDKVADARN